MIPTIGVIITIVILIIDQPDILSFLDYHNVYKVVSRFDDAQAGITLIVKKRYYHGKKSQGSPHNYRHGFCVQKALENRRRVKQLIGNTSMIVTTLL